jgi:gamma-glutamyl:cysteine ligase YbdK (ATP-grasp superfamily)
VATTAEELAKFPYTFDIEEEFFLTHPKSRTLATSVPRSLLHACQRRFGDAVAPEMLNSQIELVSPVFERHEQAAEQMMRLRRGVAEIAIEKDLRLMASGTHPIAAWRAQVETPKAHYRELMHDFQIVGRRNVLCGLHIHVAVPPQVDRVVLMNRVLHWVPVFLALSTSSPFWNREASGLLSYRLPAGQAATPVRVACGDGCVRDQRLPLPHALPASRYRRADTRSRCPCVEAAGPARRLVRQEHDSRAADARLAAHRAAA